MEFDETTSKPLHQSFKRVILWIGIVSAIGVSLFFLTVYSLRDTGKYFQFQTPDHRTVTARLLQSRISGLTGTQNYYVSIDGNTLPLCQIFWGSEERVGLIRIAPEGQKAIFEVTGHGVPNYGVLYELNTGRFSQTNIQPLNDPTDSWERKSWHPAVH